MPDKRAHRYFFSHLMKTGGTTFREHIKANFEHGEIYPARGVDGSTFEASVMIANILGLAPERKNEVRVFCGHFPYAVAGELGIDLVTMTLIRDPVARTISYLRHAEREHPRHRGWDLVKIYEDAFYFPTMMENHQSKVFSMRPDDRFESYMDIIAVDATRLEAAKENLEKVDVVGLTERFGDFLRVLEADYGWTFVEIPDLNVAKGEYEAPPALVDRIREDNAMDMEFYEYARALEERRHAERLGRTRARA